MTDIFREVDEEIRRDQLSRIWKRHGSKIVALAILLVAAVGGWRLYQAYEFNARAGAGEAYEAAIALANSDRPKEAVEALTPLAASGPGGYQALARFMAAGEMSKFDRPGAVAAFEALAADATLPNTLRDLARLRAAGLLVDTAPLADIEARLRPLAAPGATFRHAARELLAISAYRTGDLPAATATLDLIIADSETPPGARQRAEFLIGLVRAGPAARS